MTHEINMDENYKDIDYIDEWGMAYVWNGKLGVEYNYCVEGEQNSCAIYLMYEDENGDWHTDTDKYIHYEIDWNIHDWEKKLIDKMREVLKDWSDEVC